MEIVRCDQGSADAWNECVRALPTASFYHRYEWRRVNERCFGHASAYLAAQDNGRFVGLFPLVQLKSRLFGNIACSLPFVNYGGPCGESDAAVSALMDGAAAVADEWRVEYVEIRSRRYLGDMLPASDQKVSMTLDLDGNSETLWNAFKTEHRREIRKAVKNGFVARFGGAELVDDFFSVFSETWRDLGTPVYSKTYFESILETFGPAIRICVVYQGDEPAAAAFDGLHGDTIEGMWMGTRAKFRNQLAGYLLYWEQIKHGCEQGFQKYHLGRSTVQSGGEVFKKKWNARTEQLYWHYLLRTRRDLPQLNVRNPKYRLAIAAWQRLPLQMSRIIGPYIARSIP